MNRISKISRVSFFAAILWLLFEPASVQLGAVYAQSANWTKLTSPSNETLRSIHFLDESNGWAAGTNATLLKTTNGGTSWTAANTSFAAEIREFNSIRFLNSNIGWLGSTTGFARTADGGATWTPVGIILDLSGVRISPFNAFVPLSETQIRFAGAGLMGTTRVGAAVTAEINLANPAGSPRIFDTLGISPSNPALSRHVNAFSVVPGVGTWYVMDDGGAARTQGTGTTGFVGMSLSSPINLYGVQMLSGTLGYAVGANGTILKTSGGTSWAMQTSEVMQSLRALHFLDDQRGWVVGDAGTILSTTDGGTTWKKEISGTSENLLAVWAASATTVYVAGANGTLLKQGASTPSALANLSAASYTNAFAPESITASFGSNLSSTVEIASASPLPLSLAGVTVKVRDSAGVERIAPLFFVAPTQINYQLPAGTATGTATVSVVNAGGSVLARGDITVTAVAPGLFTANSNGQGVPAAVVLRIKADGSQSYESLARLEGNRFVATPIDLGAASDQVFLILFATGLRGRSSLATVIATIGGTAAEVLYAGIAPDLIGVDQINLRLPRSVGGRGEVSVDLTVDGKAANSVIVRIQ
ncbi:MAG TPA: YCF48-related protein [Blastocatellia bacterium]|nr:YCF48-related protein [Blastocatellia bacterium]